MKICMRPNLSEVKPENGLGRVVMEMHRHLTPLGFEFVDSNADLYVGHTHQFDMPRLDIMVCHGLYWTGDLHSGEYGTFHLRANTQIIAAARQAHTIVVPSEWVGMPFKRDMRVAPVVIGHGINFDDWTPGENGNYALWNKNRVFDVCRPDAAIELAKRGLHVVSTFGDERQDPPPALHIIGKQPFSHMREYIRNAGVYLATTKETFGIGTLEAMACGVPIVGWNFGGTSEIVTSGFDGLLVEPYDYDALYRAALDAYAQRARLGANARETARQYSWECNAEKYAALFQQVYDDLQSERRGWSIVITAHNYAQYIDDAVQSALAQTRAADEVIVVDDGSTDDTLQHLAGYGDKIKVIAQSNQGVAAARTVGIASATYPLITCLDADDKLDPRFGDVLLPAIEGQRDMGIVYSGLMLFDTDKAWKSDGFPPPFDWDVQAMPHTPPANCIPSACIFSKTMWYRAGPHRQEYAPGEDAEFWTRGLSVGFRAIKASDEGLFFYRLHGASASRRLQYKAIDARLPFMRDKRYPLAAPSKHAPLIMSYSRPKVSVVIPVGKAHQQIVTDAIDSLLAQAMREWECIVADDTGSEDFAPYLLSRYPFVNLIEVHGKHGAGRARNAGLFEARAPLVLFLDADDVLMSTALAEMLQAFIASGEKYIYTDCLMIDRDGKSETLEAAEYQQRVWKADGLHSVTALIPTKWAREVRFDESLATWEEGDFFTRMALLGHCGQRLPKPLLLYRTWTGTRRAASKTKQKAALKHQAELEGLTMGSCCGGNGTELLAAKQALSGMTTHVLPEGRVHLEYIGPNTGAISFYGNVTGKEYRGANNDEERFVEADARDVQRLLDTGKWRIMAGGIIQAASA